MRNFRLNKICRSLLLGLFSINFLLLIFSFSINNSYAQDNSTIKVYGLSEVTTCIALKESIEKSTEANEKIVYQSLYDDYEDQPIIGIANERQNRPLVIDGLLIEVYSANGINPKNIEL